MSESPASGTIRKKIVTARKDYKCCECRKDINKGEKHESYEACWPSINGWDTFRTCMKCSIIRELAVEKYPIYWNDEYPAFGELSEFIRDRRKQFNPPRRRLEE